MKHLLLFAAVTLMGLATSASAVGATIQDAFKADKLA